jgi:hypothetical protein
VGEVHDRVRLNVEVCSEEGGESEIWSGLGRGGLVDSKVDGMVYVILGWVHEGDCI